MNQNLELKLQSWVDGELTASEARGVGRELEGNVQASRLVAELQSIKTALAGNELALTVPETREFYWSKIQRQIERESRTAQPSRPITQPAWRRWLAPLSGFGSLACMLYLAVRPPSLPTFDEISSTGEGMEAVTFNDQSANMTVVWLADPNAVETSQPLESPQPKTADSADSEVEME